MSQGTDARRAPAARARRVVVKVGSALLAAGRSTLYARLARDVGAARAAGVEVVLVSSGAIALGLSIMGWARRPSTLAQLQAAAAAGQPTLMRLWGRALGRYELPAAQVLLTHADLTHRERFMNARRAMAELLAHGVVPVVNENDTVATEEIRVGDNDQLASHVAALVDADLLVMLTTVDGLHTGNPERDAAATRLAHVSDAAAVAHLAGAAGTSGLGVGGMVTKVLAAQLAAHRGIAVVIASGRRQQPLAVVRAGRDVGTYFAPRPALRGRKHWIGYTLRERGRVTVDAGAAAAIERHGKSLLPRGVVAVEGTFVRGAMVSIHGPHGRIARGLVAYDAAALKCVMGHHSRDIQRILGYVAAAEVVHRDDMVLLGTVT